jgi:hypothetical protein
MKRPFAFLVFMFMMVAIGEAQDLIVLMNGQEFRCKILTDEGTVFRVSAPNRFGKIKAYDLHKSDVFSFRMADSKESILYVQDTILGDVYTPDEMRFYLAGQRDARNNFKAWPTFFVGMAGCMVASYLGGDGLITTLAPPLLYTSIQLVPKIKIREKTMSSLDYKYNDLYLEGYVPPARSRKLIRAIEGGFLGSALGLTLWYLKQ